MPRVSVWFFFVAVIYALIGMIWGEYMAMTHDHSLFPAHAHLNLLGWVSMAIYGTFYALARDRVSMRLAWVQFAVSNLGLLAMIPLVAWLLATGDESLGPVAGIAAAIIILGQLLFAASVLRVLRRA